MKKKCFGFNWCQISFKVKVKCQFTVGSSRYVWSLFLLWQWNSSLLFLFSSQVVSLSLPMQEWRTAPSSSATMASASCAVTRGRRSCRSRAPVTSCTDLKPSGWPLPRWLKPFWGPRRGRWRSTCTTKTVGHQNKIYAEVGLGGTFIDVKLISVFGELVDESGIKHCLLISESGSCIQKYKTRVRAVSGVACHPDTSWMWQFHEKMVLFP